MSGEEFSLISVLTEIKEPPTMRCMELAPKAEKLSCTRAKWACCGHGTGAVFGLVIGLVFGSIFLPHNFC